MLSYSVMSYCDTIDCSLPGFSDSGIFPRQEYRSGLPCPPRDLPDSGIKPTSLKSSALLAGSLPLDNTKEGAINKTAQDTFHIFLLLFIM